MDDGGPNVPGVLLLALICVPAALILFWATQANAVTFTQYLSAFPVLLSGQ